MTKYRLSSSWRVTQRGDMLRLFGGDDAVYEVGAGSAPSFFTKIGSKQFTRSTVPARERDLLEHLLTAGVVEVVSSIRPSAAIRVIGNKARLKALRLDQLAGVSEDDSASLLLIVRTNETHSSLMSKVAYETVTTPHLYIDVAYHHTVSVGPLVFPGDTACVGCLAGRLATKWGEESPPRQPRVLREDKALIAAYIKSEVDRVIQGDTSLVGRTYSWNLVDRTMSEHRLLKVDSCPMCATNRQRSGKIAL